MSNRTWTVATWISSLGFGITIVTLLIGIGVWISAVQKDIVQVKLDILTANVSVERLRTEGTRLSQSQQTNISVIQNTLEHIKSGLDENKVAHEKIMAAIEKKM